MTDGDPVGLELGELAAEVAEILRVLEAVVELEPERRLHLL